jgi:hypothetical protein
VCCWCLVSLLERCFLLVRANQHSLTHSLTYSLTAALGSFLAGLVSTVLCCIVSKSYVQHADHNDLYFWRIGDLEQTGLGLQRGTVTRALLLFCVDLFIFAGPLFPFSHSSTSMALNTSLPASQPPEPYPCQRSPLGKSGLR